MSFRKPDFTENESSNQETDDKTPGSETDNESSMSSTANSMSKPNEEEKQEKKQIEQGNCYWYFWIHCYTIPIKIVLLCLNFSGKDRNLNIVELLCANCARWFHESCIGYQLGKLVPFLFNYVFHCKNCSPTGLEMFRKSQAREFFDSTLQWFLLCFQ